jgi:hypothetical protein
VFHFNLNGTHKVNLGPVVPLNSTSDNQDKSNIAFVDCPAFYDAYLLNDRSSLASPADATYCLPCLDQYPSPSSVNCFLQSFDVLAQSRILSRLLPSVTISSSYKLLSNSDPQYYVILLEARRLQLNLSNYDDRVIMPLQNPAVYHSNQPNELPIVIDTGASCSITPVHSDFISTILPSDVPALNNISGTTAVVGQGTIEWRIQDAKGIVRPIQTSAYYVPKATIRLFSPQVYIRNDTSNTSEMILRKNGIHLVLSCGTRLYFPINSCSNLPLMLTEAALNKGNKQGTFTAFHLRDKYSFQPSADRVNLQLLTNQLSIFQSTILDKSLLGRDNINLSPGSKRITTLALSTWAC